MSESPDEPASGMKQEIAGASFWSVINSVSEFSLRFLSTIILTRLLTKEVYGLLAIAQSLLIGFALFSDVGLGPSVIQSKFGAERRFLNTAWTVQVVRGVIIGLLVVVLAGPAASWYGNPELQGLLMVLALSAAIAGLASTKMFLAERNLLMSRLTIVEVSSRIVGLAVTIAWAVQSPTVYAVAGGGIAAELTKVVGSHIFLPGPRNGFAFYRQYAHEILRMGRWIFFGTVLTFLAGHTDRLVFGKLVPLGIVGLYSVARQLSRMPITLLGKVESMVVFPALSHYHREGTDLGGPAARLRGGLLLAAGWACAGLLGGGSVIVELIYDDRWAASGWILQMLVLATWGEMLQRTCGSVLFAVGKTRFLVTSGIIHVAGFVVFPLAGLRALRLPRCTDRAGAGRASALRGDDRGDGGQLRLAVLRDGPRTFRVRRRHRWWHGGIGELGTWGTPRFPLGMRVRLRRGERSVDSPGTYLHGAK